MGERPGGWRRWATGVVTVGLVLLVVGWWRSEVARPEQEVLREFYRTEYGQLRRAWDGRAWEGVAGAESIGALVEEAWRGQEAALGMFVERDVRVWWWNGMVSTSFRVPESGWEFWVVFASRKLDLQRVRRRALGSGELQFTLDYRLDGGVTFKRGRDSAVFGCNRGGALEYVRLPLNDGMIRMVGWDAGGRVVSDGLERGGERAADGR